MLKIKLNQGCNRQKFRQPKTSYQRDGIDSNIFGKTQLLPH